MADRKDQSLTVNRSPANQEQPNNLRQIGYIAGKT